MYTERISRPFFVNWLNQWRDKDLIKVITGIRRCGKTTLFDLFRVHLLSNGVSDNQIISLNFENPDIPPFANWREAWLYIKGLVSESKAKTYIFLDEVQVVPEFERLVDGIYSLKNFDVYITGSNAKFLSGELATFLTGRYVEIRLQPLNFAEYRPLFPDKPSGELLVDYMTYGGFPFAALMEKESRFQSDYLSGILDTILYKDIVSRNGYRDVATLKRIVKFLFDNIGNLFSVNKIVGTFKSEGVSIPHATLDAYIESLCETFLLDRVSRYDIKGREILRTTAKYYLADTGLRRILLGDRRRDLGRVLENIVYLELKHRYHDVYVGVFGHGEIDFVAMRNAAPIYIQVSLSVREETTLYRELTPLKAIRDNNPKFLLTLDNDPPGNEDGIRLLSVLDFLLDPKAFEML